jgi:predicted MFS family arabinose efflux permease
LQRTPDQVRGRVFSTEFAIFTLMSATGSAGGGWLLDNSALGLSGMLRLMAGLVLIPGALWVLWNLFWRKKQTRQPNSPLDVDVL